jgi:hypothetical protein
MYDEFLEHDRKDTEWLQRRPVCAYCGEHIQDPVCYCVNGRHYCTLTECQEAAWESIKGLFLASTIDCE